MARTSRTAKARPPPHAAKKGKGARPANALKRAKTTATGSSTTRERPVFCFHYADRTSTNVWRFAPTDIHAPELFEFICDMARLTWGDIESQRAGGHKKHHSQSIGSFVSAAQADIVRTRLDETFGDDMFRFRLSGKKRLWGFRRGATFHVVWWDWDHKVYPTEPN